MEHTHFIAIGCLLIIKSSVLMSKSSSLRYLIVLKVIMVFSRFNFLKSEATNCYLDSKIFKAPIYSVRIH